MHEWHQSQIDSYMGCSSLYFIYYRSCFLNICPLVVGRVLFTQLVRKCYLLTCLAFENSFQLDCAGTAEACAGFRAVT